jgi:hypothetical protein
MDDVARSPRSQRRRPRWWIYPGPVILAVVLAILPGILQPERACTPDSQRYLQLGQELLAQGHYCNPDGSPHATTPPLYPLLAGIATLGPAGRAALLLLQGLLFLWSVRSLRRLAEHAGFTRRDSWKPALLYGLSPLALVYAGRILSETLFVALLLAGLDLFFTGTGAPDSPGGPGEDSSRTRRRWTAVGSGIFIGLATLTRVIILPWILLWPILALTLPRMRARILIALAGAILVLSPWVIRNVSEFATPELSPAAGTNALEYAAALISSPEERSLALEQERGPHPLANPFAEGRAKGRAAWTILRARPLRFAVQVAATLPAFCAPPVMDVLQSLGAQEPPLGTAAVLQQGGAGSAVRHLSRHLARRPIVPVALAAAVSLWDVAISLAALAGLGLALLTAARNRSRGGGISPPGREQLAAQLPLSTSGMTLIFLGSLVLVLLIAPAGAWHPRFRVPLTPALAVIACCALVRPSPQDPGSRGRDPVATDADATRL